MFPGWERFIPSLGTISRSRPDGQPLGSGSPAVAYLVSDKRHLIFSKCHLFLSKCHLFHRLFGMNY